MAGGIGGGSLASSDNSLIQQMLQQLGGLTSSQSAAGALVPGQNAATIAQYNQLTQQILGETPQQQKAAVNFGQMDFLKTSPQGLLNTPNTGSMGLV
jgi:hypothetical protein